MALHINDLPVEILSNVLQRVRNSSTLPEVKDFVGLLTCCKYWHDVAKPILWRDVVLINSTITTFSSKISSENAEFVRSLTLRLAVVKEPWLNKRRGHMYMESEPHQFPAIQALWHGLQNLAPAVRTMTNLNTFSLTVGRDYGLIDIRDFGLRVKDLRNLLESLPPSCANLELDTWGLECQTVGPSDNSSASIHQHLCTTIADLLPRLQHVRLQLKTICDKIFLEKNTPTRPTGFCDKDKIRYFSAPRLQSLVIGMYPRHGPFYYSSGEEHAMDLGDVRYDEALRVTNAAQAAYLAGAFPSATKLSTFHLMRSIRMSSYNSKYESQFDTLNERDILQNKPRQISYVLPDPKASFEMIVDQRMLLLRRDSQGIRTEIWGRQHEICRFMEGSVFRTTPSLSRHPAKFASSPAAHAAGYQFDDLDVEVVVSPSQDLQYFCNDGPPKIFP